MKVIDLFERDDFEDKAAPTSLRSSMLRVKKQMQGADNQLDLLIRRIQQLELKGILTQERKNEGGTHMKFHVPAGLVNHDEIEYWYHVEPGEVGPKRMQALVKLQIQCQDTWNHYTVLKRELENLQKRADDEST